MAEHDWRGAKPILEAGERAFLGLQTRERANG